MFGKCEFCGNDKELGDSTPFHGFYCKECMQMNIDYDKESIKNMKPSKRKKISAEDLAKLEREKDEALAMLMNFGN